MKTRKSIFEIERRINLLDEHGRLVRYMKTEPVLYRFGGFDSFYHVIDESVPLWKYRNTAFNISQYMMQIGINDLSSDSYINDEGVVACLELYLNLVLVGASNIDKSKWNMETKQRFHTASTRVVENISYILENINMGYTKIDDRIVIHKRDVDVDSILESRPELADVLLGYLDFRNHNDTSFKKQALVEIASYMENDRGKYKSLNADQTNTLFYAFNSFGIRHNNDKQVSFETSKERNVFYDKVFKLAVHILRTEEVNDFVSDINSYKR